MRLIHISDLHLTDLSTVDRQEIRGKRRLGHLSWRGRRRHRHLPVYLEALRRAVRDAQPDFIVVTGDLIHIGLPSELAAAANWLEALAPSGRVLVTPGNHDLYADDSWAACEEHWGRYLHLSPTADAAWEAPLRRGFPSRVRLDGMDLYGLNTGCPT
ncbi:MAG: metallophosphoesterase, partial [Gammaproteobacteria bacterium]|nr:metallophosphoesterase [Gammaproteobacteria bacterium]